jgi:hypothetical protein
MTQLTFTVARRIATSLESGNPGVVCMISDVPQRGKVKELAFKVTVWEASPDMYQNVNKFTVTTEEEYDRIETIISILNLTNRQQVTNEQATLK